MSVPLESEAVDYRDSVYDEFFDIAAAEQPISSVLPQSPGSRFVLVLVNAFLIPSTILVLQVLHTIPLPQAWQWRVVYYLFLECVVAFGMICVLSGLWGIYRARWIAKVFDGLYTKFFLVLFVSLLAAWLSMILTG
ncbi:MAG: hypothetical protein DWQ37_02145 [Planctomycetota bacterium]|nr:MAG: hypothetical protein DWQ37_02145 [Planctomycetota bacterium]